MPRLKREVSIEGVVAVLLLVWQLVSGWGHQSYIVDTVRESLAQQARSIASLVSDTEELKRKVSLHDYQLNRRVDR